jgi:hypothetical protein
MIPKIPNWLICYLSGKHLYSGDLEESDIPADTQHPLG